MILSWRIAYDYRQFSIDLFRGGSMLIRIRAVPVIPLNESSLRREQRKLQAFRP